MGRYLYRWLTAYFEGRLNQHFVALETFKPLLYNWHCVSSIVNNFPTALHSGYWMDATDDSVSCSSKLWTRLTSHRGILYSQRLLMLCSKRLNHCPHLWFVQQFEYVWHLINMLIYSCFSCLEKNRWWVRKRYVIFLNSYRAIYLLITVCQTGSIQTQ